MSVIFDKKRKGFDFSVICFCYVYFALLATLIRSVFVHV